jgi:histidine kinase
VRSVLCVPIVAATELIGLLYLENNQLAGCFTQQRLSTLEIICLAAAGRIELSRKAAVDGLTQLFNHDYFQNMLRQEIAGAQRHERPLSLILCDIDHFKRFNDTWGHQVGDQVLREVADVLRLNAREGDVVARYGGEEMAIILPSTSQAEALIVAERLRSSTAARKVTSGNNTLSVTASFGVSTLGRGIIDATELVRAADAALYQSKGAGRNCVTAA